MHTETEAGLFQRLFKYQNIVNQEDLEEEANFQRLADKTARYYLQDYKTKVYHLDERKNAYYSFQANILSLSDDKEYLLCRGPKNTAIDVFWRVISPLSRVVVDLTHENEGWLRLRDYGPQTIGVPCQYISDFNNELTITLLEQKRIHTSISILRYSCSIDGLESMITRIFYHNWPGLEGISIEDLEVLTDCCESERSLSPHKALAIHCHAGVGRSGTLAVALAMKTLIKSEETSSPESLREIVDDLIIEGRIQRSPSFVEDPSQLSTLYTYAEYLSSKARPQLE
jgi:protein tyrosine phosphatase